MTRRHTQIGWSFLLLVSLAPRAAAQDPFVATGSTYSLAAQSHGISFDGAEWHIASFASGWRVYDATFVFQRAEPLPAGGSLRGLAYHQGVGNLFLGNYGASLVHEVTTAGMLLSTFSSNVPSGFNAIAVNDNDDTLWLVGFQGDVVNVTTAGALISSFTTPGLNWTGAAYDEVRDTLLLLETGDRLYEYTPAGAQVGVHAAPVDFVPGNGQGLDYDSVTGILHVAAQSGDIAIYSRSGGGVPPTCTLTGPASVVTGDAGITIDSMSMSAPTVDITFDHSEDGGATWAPCTPAGGSPLPTNPATGVAVGVASFLWATDVDGVGSVALAAGVLVRATIDDGVAATTGGCQSLPFDVDNSALCQAICGDCNVSGSGPDILDALAGAQIAAGLIVASPAQIGCCDVNSSMTIEVLDALLMAQNAAGLPGSLVCP